MLSRTLKLQALSFHARRIRHRRHLNVTWAEMARLSNRSCSRQRCVKMGGDFLVSSGSEIPVLLGTPFGP